MKKILIFLFLIVTLFTTNITISANEVTYKNLIDDNTTIEDDFKILGLDINNYSIPTNFVNDKWYVVGMAEAYLDANSIQTYFYLYNMTGVDYNRITADYKINNTISSIDLYILDTTPYRGLIKTKGFKYYYDDTANISITKISSTSESYDGPNSDEPIISYLENNINFVANNTHDKNNETITTNLNFDSTIIINEYTVKSIAIPRENGFWVTVGDIFSKDIWTNSYTTTDLIFYNFNFPDSIHPDKIEQAVFNYDYVDYKKSVGSVNTNELKRDQIRPQPVDGFYNKDDLGVYTNGTHTFKASNCSAELTFETFVLGNRIDKGEFDYIDMSSLKDDFSYDASVLLGCTYDTIYYETNVNEYSKMENIEFIELEWWQNDVLYKSQVISDIVETPEEETPPAKTPWFLQLLIDIANFLLKLVGINPAIVPDIVKYAISSVVLVLLLILIIVLFPTLITISSAIINASSFIIKKIIQIITAPFRLFKRN